MLFDKNAFESSTPIGKKSKQLTCIKCGLYKICASPKLKPSGTGKNGVMLVFSSPNYKEDGAGRYGRDRGYVEEALAQHDIDFDDCIITAAVKCKPYEMEIERDPTNLEVDTCRKFVLGVIKEHEPKLILCFGKQALASVIGDRWPDDVGVIDKWRGYVIPDQDLKTFVAPVHSPDTFNKKDITKGLVIFKADIADAIAKLDEEFPLFIKPNITVLKPKNLKELDNIKSEFAAFDYETPALKPHPEGRKITCASIAVSPMDVFVFMMPKKEVNRKPFIRFLKNKKIKKIAQNCLHGRSWVYMEDGSKVMISKLVNQKIKGNVLSYNEETNKVEPKPITNWFRSEDKDVKWFKILTKDSIKGQGHGMTPDHKVYLKEKGMTRVDKVTIGDSLLILKPTLSKIQKQILLASHFGDGSFYKQKGSKSKNASFSISHSNKQKNYLDWKHSILKNVSSFIEKTNNNQGYGENTERNISLYSFRVMSLPVITSMWKEGYKEGRKIATTKMLNKLTPLGIAIWYMDDGSFTKSKYGGTIRISTEAFDKESINNIIEYFKKKHKVCFTFTKRKGVDYGYLRVYRKNEVAIFSKIVEPYMHPDCFYKMPYVSERTGIKSAQIASNIKRIQHSYSKIIGVEETKKTSQCFTRFCIEVRDNHNFFTTTGLVNNCKFEESWSYNTLGTRVKKWFWDTMLFTHIADNRAGVTGLKIQTYLQFGIIEYNQDVKQYFQSVEEKNGNSLNRIDELIATEKGRETLLTYCAWDSIFEYRLAMIQMDIMNNKIVPF